MKTLVLRTDSVTLNGSPILIDGCCGRDLLTYIYKSTKAAYPKFYKMDPLCRLGFVAAELLLGDEDSVEKNGDNHAVVIVGRSGSIADDRKYQETINCADEFFPSPAVFVYTLANIVTGEIAIRHKLYAETSSFMIDSFDPDMVCVLMSTALNDNNVMRVTGGWINCENPDSFELYFVSASREDFSSGAVRRFLQDVQKS